MYDTLNVIEFSKKYSVMRNPWSSILVAHGKRDGLLQRVPSKTDVLLKFEGGINLENTVCVVASESAPILENNYNAIS